MVFGEVSAALSILERLKKWWDSSKRGPVESVATRFVRVFESHGVHRNQIPRFLEHGLTLVDVQDDASLLSRLDERLLDMTCTRLAVRREWLDGAERQVHPTHDFYKWPEEFAAFLDEKLSGNPKGLSTGVLLVPAEKSSNGETLMILEESIGLVGDKPIHRYHLVQGGLFGYWKSRAYLAACIAIAWKRHVYVRGAFLSGQEIQELAEGTTLLGWQGEGIGHLGSKRWYPEDMALQPEAFLDGLESERDNFGIKAGLQLWLDLEKRGLMNTGGASPDARAKFEQALAKYLTR